MKTVSFKALVAKYVALNFFILTAVFFIIPMYPWWFFLVVGVVSKIYQLSVSS